MFICKYKTRARVFQVFLSDLFLMLLLFQKLSLQGSDAPQIKDCGCRQGWRRASEPQDVSESLSCHKEPPPKALGEVDLTKSKTKGAALHMQCGSVALLKAKRSLSRVSHRKHIRLNCWLWL